MVIDETPKRDRHSPDRLVPLLRLIAAMRLAFDLRKLLIATLGLVCLQLGWSVLDAALPSSRAVTPDPFETTQPTVARTEGPAWLGDGVATLSFRLAQPVRLLTTPLRALLDPASGWEKMLHSLLGLIWLMIVWGICGGAIARIGIVQLAKMRQSGIGEGFRFARRSAGPLIVAPLCPL